MGVICLLLLLVLFISVVTCTIFYRLLILSNMALNSTQHILLVLRKWDNREEQQKDYLRNKLKAKDCNKIAIYGCSVIGKRMARELENTEIDVKCFIDKNAANINMNKLVLPSADNLPDVDAIIITVVSQYSNIKKTLCGKVECPIIAFEELL